MDVADRLGFVGSLGRPAGAPYLDYFDFDGDGRVGLIDLLAFARPVGTRLSP